MRATPASRSLRLLACAALAALVLPQLAAADSERELRALPDHALAASDDVGRALFTERDSGTVRAPAHVRKRTASEPEAPPGELPAWPEGWSAAPAAPADDY